jgi:hypothetical protein
VRKAQISNVGRENHNIGLHGDEQEKEENQPHCNVWGLRKRRVEAPRVHKGKPENGK